MTLLLPTAYFPSIFYLRTLFASQEVKIEAHEHFPKQTIRNRCEILTGNGVQKLSVPVKHSIAKIPINSLLIATEGTWKTDHWRAIESAYAAAPYFEDYAAEIKHLILNHPEKLIDLNTEIHRFICSVLDIPFSYSLTNEYVFEKENDFREVDFFDKRIEQKSYQQVFSYNLPFEKNLSVIDLLFNEGPFMRNWLLPSEN